ncbi:MAG TPA: hypothetical protein PLD59_12865 [Tepidisphaeraceae bacterium]|nr:hypothetical protein [Tepidisphaeraceae bacterium]
MTATIDDIAKDVRGFVSRAAAGETITIIDNGRPLAKLVSGIAANTQLDDAIAQGRLIAPIGPKRDISEIPLAQVGGKPASEMIIEDRR